MRSTSAGAEAQDVILTKIYWKRLIGGEGLNGPFLIAMVAGISLFAGVIAYFTLLNQNAGQEFVAGCRWPYRSRYGGWARNCLPQILPNCVARKLMAKRTYARHSNKVAVKRIPLIEYHVVPNGRRWDVERADACIGAFFYDGHTAIGIARRHCGRLAPPIFALRFM